MKLAPLNKLGNGFAVFHVKKRSNQHKYEQKAEFEGWDSYSPAQCEHS